MTLQRDDLRELGRIAHRMRKWSYSTKDGLDREADIIRAADRLVAVIHGLYLDRKRLDESIARMLAALEREQVVNRPNVNASGQRYMSG